MRKKTHTHSWGPLYNYRVLFFCWWAKEAWIFLIQAVCVLNSRLSDENWKAAAIGNRLHPKIPLIIKGTQLILLRSSSAVVAAVSQKRNGMVLVVESGSNRWWPHLSHTHSACVRAFHISYNFKKEKLKTFFLTHYAELAHRNTYQQQSLSEFKVKQVKTTLKEVVN